MVRKLFCGFNLAKWEWKLIRIGVCVSLTFTHSSQCWENMRYLPTSHLHEEHERRCKLALPSSLNLVAFLWPPLPGWHEEVAPSDSWTTSSFFFFLDHFLNTLSERGKGGLGSASLINLGTVDWQSWNHIALTSSKWVWNQIPWKFSKVHKVRVTT